MTDAQPRPRGALILVRNTVTHDARILREARTLRGLGYRVLIAGVISTEERQQRLEIDGTQVVRLDPAGLLRRVARLGRPSIESTDASGEPPALGAETAARPAGSAGGMRARAARVALTAAYYLRGAGLVVREAPAIVHANDYNTMWIALLAKLLRRSRIVYDCHELWPDRNGRPEWRAWLIACEWLFVRLADQVITTSPGYARAISERYRVAQPRVVRNIPERVAAPSPPVREGRNGSDEICGVYLGGVMPGRGLEQAISALPLAPHARLRLIGPGRPGYRASLLEQAREEAVADRVELPPPVAPSQVIDAIAAADFGLMLIQPVCRSYELTLPNKLFEYAAAGLPILASDLPVIGVVVREQGLGEVVPPDDVRLIAQAMVRLGDRDAAGALRERVAAYARRETWDAERRLLERVYEDLALSSV